MCNSCINPCQSLGYRSSHSLSFTDYHTSCFLNDRFVRRTPISYPPTSSSCCCGCSNSICRLPINPSLLYGLRQSTLIQWSPYRRMILSGGSTCLSRFSVFDIDRSCSYEKYGSLKEKGGGRKGGRWGKGRYGRMVYEESGGGDSFGSVSDEVEMMLSLLTEEVGEECFGVWERNSRSSWRVKVEDKKRENNDGISYRSGKKNEGSVGFKSSSKRDQEYDGARYRDEVKKQKEERERISRCEDCKLKIEGSTSKSNKKYDIARYREEIRRQKEYRKEEGLENNFRNENRRERKEELASKSDQEYDTSWYRDEIKRQKEDMREEMIENNYRTENCRVRREESAWKSDQEYDTNRYREEMKRHKEDRREEERENMSGFENSRTRNEGSTLKSDQEYDTSRYRVEIRRHEEDRKDEEKENILRSENRKVKKEGSTLKSDQEYDTSRYRVEIRRHEEDRKDEEKENILRSENRKVRKEGSTFRIYKEYDTAGYGEEIKKQKDARIEDERDSISRSENRRLRKDGSSCSSYYSMSSAGEFESDSELQVKDDTFVGQPSIEYKRDQTSKEDIRYDGEIKEDIRYDGEVKKKEKNGESDWRKKSEKKISEVIIEQAKSRKKLAEENMRLSRIEQQSYVQRSDIEQQYIDKKEKLTLDVNINVGINDDKISGQSESRIRHKEFSEQSELDSTVVETSSSSQKQYSGTEKNESTSVSLVEERKGAFSETAGYFSRQDAHRWESEQTTEVSKVEEINERGDSSSSLSETRMKNLEDNSSMVLGLVDDREEKYERGGQFGIRQAGSQVNSQQIEADIRMKKQEEKIESVNLEAKVTDTQRASKKSTNKKEMSSTSLVEFIDETRGKKSVTGKSELRIEQLKETQRPLKASSFNEGMPKEVSISYKALKLIPEDDKRSSRPPSELSSESFRSGLSELQAQREESSLTVGPDIYCGDRKGDSHEEHLDFVSHEKTRERDSLIGKGELQVGRLKATKRPVKASSFNEGMPKEVSNPYKSLKLIPESSMQQTGEDDDDKKSSRPPSEFSSASFRSGMSELIPHEDVLGSADRLHQSSTHFVGDFVEKLRQEVSISGSQKKNETHDKGTEEDKKKGIGQDHSGESRRSSRSSGVKGPSDEMWHVTDRSVQGPPEIETVPENQEHILTTTESGVVKRTGRSLWNVIGDIVRLRWVPSHSETHNLKSGGKNSPNQYTGSEARFSGHEADENNGENVKKEGPIGSQETQELTSPINKIKKDGDNSSSFSSIGGGLPLRAGSLSSIEGTSSGSGISEQSFPGPAIRMRRSPGIKYTSEASQTSASGSGKMVDIEQSVPNLLPEESVTEAKDGELKRRKFQRSDHVLRDRFDEWEEAHTIETEQRKTDEMFMMEALLEARKGADMWEVPVGAVLVQNGKIIARGYNLVEDLRDSTAHAEMICIREASNVLRTWRLSETTLYVTLEPCPMCAGAILQARVDTVVWGAPNKLLGADGSWIRLFPNGSGGNDSELGEKADAGPVHPFHPNITIRRGVLSSECADVMQQFFQLRRKNKLKKTEQQPPTPPSSGLPISHHPSKLLTKMHDVFHIMFCL